MPVQGALRLSLPSFVSFSLFFFFFYRAWRTEQKSLRAGRALDVTARVGVRRQEVGVCTCPKTQVVYQRRVFPP